MKTLATVLIALSLAACDIKSDKPAVENDETTMAITNSGQVGLRVNDVQCVNMTSGQVEICIMGIN